MSSPQDSEAISLFTSLRYDPLLLAIPANKLLSLNNSPSPYYMLTHHRDRLLAAATHFNWPAAISSITGDTGLTNLLEALNQAIGEDIKEPLRVKALLGRDGKIAVETNPIPEVSQYALFPERLPTPRSEEKKVHVSPLTGGALVLGHHETLPNTLPRTPSTTYTIIPDPSPTHPSPYTSHKTTHRSMYDLARTRANILDLAEKKEVLLTSTNNHEIMEGSLTSPYFYRDGKWTTPPVESGGQRGATRRWALENGICVEGVVTVESLVDGEECWISNGVKGFIAGEVKLR